MTPAPFAPELALARRLALEAGRRALDAAADGPVDPEKKGEVDLVTRVDRELQATIVEGLAAAFPSDRIVAEEGEAAGRPGGDERCWYVDPLDGTTNYVHGHPFYATSIALFTGATPCVGAVYAPALDELFCAVAGGGVTLERPSAGTPPRAISASRRLLGDALCATGFSYRRGREARLTLALCAHVLANARGIRRAGAAAIDLCHVAAGRLDVFFELALSPWDVAAGALVAREAGALVTDWSGGDDWLHGRRVLCAHPALHAEFLGLLRRAHERPESWPLGEPFEGAVPLDRLPGEEA